MRTKVKEPLTAEERARVTRRSTDRRRTGQAEAHALFVHDDDGIVVNLVLVTADVRRHRDSAFALRAGVTPKLSPHWRHIHRIRYG